LVQEKYDEGSREFSVKQVMEQRLKRHLPENFETRAMNKEVTYPINSKRLKVSKTENGSAEGGSWRATQRQSERAHNRRIVNQCRLRSISKVLGLQMFIISGDSVIPLRNLGFLMSTECSAELENLQEAHVFNYLRFLSVQAQLTEEILVVALTYIVRLVVENRLTMTRKTLKVVLLSAIMIAKKQTEDGRSKLDIWVNIMRDLSIDEAKSLEVEFLSLLRWRTFVSEEI